METLCFQWSYATPIKGSASPRETVTHGLRTTVLGCGSFIEALALYLALSGGSWGH